MSMTGLREAIVMRGVCVFLSAFVAQMTEAPCANAATGETYVWVANQGNYNAGTVSKISATTGKEVARYATVTCMSDPVNGSNETATFGQVNPANLCADGVHGCCSRAESVAGANNGHQPVNIYGNRPSAAVADVNGDAWIANVADFPNAAQSSVTKIAGATLECVERNGVPGIQTSADRNGDGFIDTDCNGNGIPDSIADVAATPCMPGRVQEFFGLDDECVLFTVNTGPIGQRTRALALAPGATPAALADVWAGTYGDGRYYRIDGATGAIKTTVTLAAQAGVAAHPFSAVVDRFGILWSANVDCNGPGGCLFFFDTNNTANQDMVQSGLGGNGFFGVAIDGFRQGSNLVQQVWLGEYGGYGAYRFRPVRNAGFSAIRNGTWARADVSGAGAVTQGLGIAVDNRGSACAWVALDGGGASSA